jgi:hypothetical protein
VLPEYHLGTSAIHAVYPSSRHLSPKVRTFVELAANMLGGLEAGRPATSDSARSAQ